MGDRIRQSNPADTATTMVRDKDLIDTVVQSLNIEESLPLTQYKGIIANQSVITHDGCDLYGMALSGPALRIEIERISYTRIKQLCCGQVEIDLILLERG